MLFDSLYGVLLVFLIVLLIVWKVCMVSIGLKIFFCMMWFDCDMFLSSVGGY